MTDIRRHSSRDMDGLGEFEGCTDPVAVVIRPDGSLDVYGFIGVVDQRPAEPEPEPEQPIREWTVQLIKTHYGDFVCRARTADEAIAIADADYGANAEWGETEFRAVDAFDTSQESGQ